MRTQRLRDLALFTAVFALDGGALWLAFTPYQAACSAISIAALGATAWLLLGLPFGKWDWLIRAPVVLLVVAYTGFKAFMFIDFIRNAD